MLSQVTHIIQALALPDHILDIIVSLLFQFVLGKSNSTQKVAERVKRTTLCLPVEEGGLGMISVRHQQQVSLIRLVQRWSPEDTNKTICPLYDLCICI